MSSTESKATAGTNATLHAQVMRDRKIGANVKFVTSQSRMVFRVWCAGRVVFNKETGLDEPCKRDEVGPHGLPGHWYFDGIDVSEGTTTITKKEARTIRWRIMKHKILTRIRGFVNGLQRK